MLDSHIHPAKGIENTEVLHSFFVQEQIYLRVSMEFRRACTLLIILFIFVAVTSEVRVEAARVLSEDLSASNHLATFPAMYEKAKYTMSYWLERLPSGPSPRGPGH
ncbi:unnamed protein product [Fraxinus pennsylvanica]|uniref:Uncharacterized protein n=1 Tax=Fraxinus pennsylvanica TaxID=56036 RepID=A0AAD2DS49_9LAMI|nr:unnamed protein product [Fraxinus pennsylvanica]